MSENQDPTKLFGAKWRVNSSPSCVVNSTVGLLGLHKILRFKTSICTNTKILEWAQTSVSQPLLYLKITWETPENYLKIQTQLFWGEAQIWALFRNFQVILMCRHQESQPRPRPLKRWIQCCTIPSCCWMRGWADFHASDSNGRQCSRVWFWSTSIWWRHLDSIRWVLRYFLAKYQLQAHLEIY